MSANTGEFGYDFSRQTAFAPVGAAGQAQLAAAGVLIVGLGGLGSWCSELLARMGVGQLRIVDSDQITPGNLPRQTLYSPEDINHSKVLVAAQKLRKICPHLCVEPEVKTLDAENIETLAEGMDVIVDATDDWNTRFLLNDFCVQQKRPWIFGGVVGAEGQIMAILPGQTACLRCLFDGPPPAEVEQAHKASVTGVLAPAVSAMASLQAMEAVKMIVNPGAIRKGLLKLDLWANTFQEMACRADPACPCCRRGEYDFLSR